MTSTSSSIQLFVYGTLKTGGTNHSALANQQFLGTAMTSPNYQLLDLGEFPGMAPANGLGQAIAGELYQVDLGLLPVLDEIEEAPNLFALKEITLATGKSCLAYLYQGKRLC